MSASPQSAGSGENAGSSKRFKFTQTERTRLIDEFDNWNEAKYKNYIGELREELKKKDQQIDGLQKQLTELQRLIQVGSKPKTVAKKGGIKLEWSYINKVSKILEENNKPLTKKELHQKLLEVDRGYNYKSKTPAIQRLAVHLNEGVKKKRIDVIKLNGVKTNYYILKSWKTTGGELKEEYVNYLRDCGDCNRFVL